MIILGADHGGYDLKERLKSYLTKSGESIVDVGAFKLDEMDNFSDFIRLMVSTFNQNKTAKIIAICGSGVGMSIGLNKNKGIFCANGHTAAEIAKARQHNNINALALGGRVLTLSKAKKMVDAFLTTEFLDGKYKKRMQAIDNK